MFDYLKKIKEGFRNWFWPNKANNRNVESNLQIKVDDLKIIVEKNIGEIDNMNNFSKKINKSSKDQETQVD